MNKITSKIITILSIGALSLVIVVPTYASTNAQISGNGSGSDNRIFISSQNRVNVSQYNESDISNNIHVSSNTGDNRANGNNRSDNDIRTGNSNTSIDIHNHANMNSALIMGSNFNHTSARIASNNARSDNEVRLNQMNLIQIDQNNNADFENNIESHSNTGSNHSNDNTRGESSIVSGNSHTSIGVHNMANVNNLSINGWANGGNMGGGFDNDYSSKKLFAGLTGAQEVPGSGDPDGYGHARVKLQPKNERVCVSMRIKNIESATAAHIHEAPMGASGPVVVTLPTPDSNGYVNGCVMADKDLLKEIKNNPSEYYINVHNTPYPNGAVRGQLSN